jgi:hypothetical protein
LAERKLIIGEGALPYSEAFVFMSVKDPVCGIAHANPLSLTFSEPEEWLQQFGVKESGVTENEYF